MSKLLVEIDYVVAATVIKGIREQVGKKNKMKLLEWVNQLQVILDKAVLNKGGKK